MIEFPQVQPSVLAPIGFVAIGAMVVLVGEVVVTRARTFLGRPVTESYVGTLLAIASIVSLLLAFYVSAVAFASGDTAVFNLGNPMFALDRFSALMTSVLSLSGALLVALSIGYLAEMRINHGEYYALLLIALSGMMFLVGAVDLLSVFLGVEVMSIPIYVLAGFDRRKLRSNESAIKYFLTGSFASGVLLYGMALLYGVSGSTSFEAIHAAFDPSNPMAVIGLGLVIVGFSFKISAVPFHQWAPDVYEGAPSAVTAFMSVAVKAAAFAALARFIAGVLGTGVEMLAGVVGVLAVLSMVVGNVMAVIQDNVKRMLAYSSIAHAGYMLVGLAAGGAAGFSAIVFYLIAYTFMNLGAFGIVVALAHRGQDCERIESFAGLARSRPGMAALMTLFMLSLAGIPGTVGFIAKFNIFIAAIRAEMIWLPVLVALTSVVSVFYYLRIPVLMYMREPAEEAPRSEIASGEALVLGFCALAVLFLGILPNDGSLPVIGLDLPVIDWANASVAQFFLD